MSRSNRLRDDRQKLLTLLRRDGLRLATPERPLFKPDGRAVDWWLDTLRVTLTPEGARLAGRCLLRLLERFDGRQLATGGTIGIPLLQACVALSGGRYRGLIVRKELKPYGTRLWIEGPVDTAEPVVLVDDSLVSGFAMDAARRRLEAAGLRVEGGVVLVRFGWADGFARFRSMGYHMEYLFDVWEDAIAPTPAPDAVPPNPTRTPAGLAAGGPAIPAGLTPPEAARRACAAVLAEGRLPGPPECLDQPYDSAGGAWVSLRDRAEPRRRYARAGFWRFPEEGDPADPAADLVAAAVRVALELPPGREGLDLLDRSAVGVTFFSRLKPCTLGELDNRRYGIVVRSRDRPHRMGGALPGMPGIAGEWAQFEHARATNAGLLPAESWQLFRHSLVKVVEPDVAWPPGGVPAAATDPGWNRTPDGFFPGRRPVEGGDGAAWPRLASAWAGFLSRVVGAAGAVPSGYHPFQDRFDPALDAAGTARLAWSLARHAGRVSASGLGDQVRRILRPLVTGLRRIPGDGLRWAEPSHGSTISAHAWLLLALCHLPSEEPGAGLIPDLEAALWGTLDRHGRIVDNRMAEDGVEVEEDVGGLVLLALAYAACAGHSAWDRARWLTAFRFYRHRFRYAGSVRPMPGLMQAFSVGARAAADEEVAAAAHEVAARALSCLSRRTGEFFTGDPAGPPTVRTALCLEGLGAVVDLAVELGQGLLVRKYRRAVDAGCRLLDRLTIQGPDGGGLPGLSRASGGVRDGRGLSRVDIAGVGHCLSTAEWVLASLQNQSVLSPSLE
ncbi:MAG TPA: hypothetical protein PLN26_10880 [Acidobacteriota bacterium]|nr:hypothetical protein [Acidobacteriota bacterium]HQG93195.1 hypothetical protein [Acidobacteriota bacterium]HQK87814.1 hypothetical protein [Acidobacteriota bacterium]